MVLVFIGYLASATTGVVLVEYHMASRPGRQRNYATLEAPEDQPRRTIEEPSHISRYSMMGFADFT
jgi:hypothetical protein